MKDYTQYGEQPAILKACGLVESGGAYVSPNGPGRFLDLGGFDPFDKSNTRALFECGWSGVIVEPEPHAVMRLVKEYGFEPRIQILQSAVANCHSWGLPMWLTEDGTSTNGEEFYEKWKGSVKYDGKVIVPHIALAQIATMFGSFDMVSIDVEGQSVNICAHLFHIGWRPKCIIVEHDERMVELCKEATMVGYAAVWVNSDNCILARR